MRKLSHAHHHHHHPSLPLMYHELRRYKQCLEQLIITLLLELLATEALTVLQAFPIIDLFGCSGRPHTHYIIDHGASLTYKGM